MFSIKNIITILMALFLVFSMLCACSQGNIDTKCTDSTCSGNNPFPTEDTDIYLYESDLLLNSNNHGSVSSLIFRGDKYYGNEFNDIASYGFYYNIIRTHKEAISLCKNGKFLDKELLNDFSIIVICCYTPYIIIPSTIGYDGVSNDKIKISMTVSDGFIESTFGSETKTIIYLLVPASSIPTNVPKLGALHYALTGPNI